MNQCQVRHFWLALTHTQDSAAMSLRQQLGLFDDMRTPLRTLDNVAAFFGRVASPQRMIAVLEALEQERQLTHKEANRVMEKILSRVDVSGRWT